YDADRKECGTEPSAESYALCTGSGRIYAWQRLGREAAQVEVGVQGFETCEEVREVAHLVDGDGSILVTDPVVGEVVSVALVFHGSDLVHVKPDHASLRLELANSRVVEKADLAASPPLVPLVGRVAQRDEECDHREATCTLGPRGLLPESHSPRPEKDE